MLWCDEVLPVTAHRDVVFKDQPLWPPKLPGLFFIRTRYQTRAPWRFELRTGLGAGGSRQVYVNSNLCLIESKSRDSIIALHIAHFTTETRLCTCTCSGWLCSWARSTMLPSPFHVSPAPIPYTFCHRNVACTVCVARTGMLPPLTTPFAGP